MNPIGISDSDFSELLYDDLPQDTNTSTDVQVLLALPFDKLARVKKYLEVRSGTKMYSMNDILHAKAALSMEDTFQLERHLRELEVDTNAPM